MPKCKELQPTSLGIDNHIEFVPDRPFQDYRYAIDSTALRSLGWKERVPFEEAVRDVVQHHVQQRVQQRVQHHVQHHVQQRVQQHQSPLIFAS
jgi:dTDP-D-glucose 4,6-dehydratase